jgi:hypothetical protein
MKIELEVANNKADFAMEVLQSLSFVKKATPQKKQKTTKITAAQKKANTKKLFAEIKEAVEEMKLIKQGKAKGRSLEDFLNEL